MRIIITYKFSSQPPHDFNALIFSNYPQGSIFTGERLSSQQRKCVARCILRRRKALIIYCLFAHSLQKFGCGAIGGWGGPQCFRGTALLTCYSIHNKMYWLDSSGSRWHGQFGAIRIDWFLMEAQFKKDWLCWRLLNIEHGCGLKERLRGFISPFMNGYQNLFSASEV